VLSTRVGDPGCFEVGGRQDLKLNHNFGCVFCPTRIECAGANGKGVSVR